jgi:mannose-6-phosphate isomerase-like protein (cupin superfamily)
MRYAMHADESSGGRLFGPERGCAHFSQRVVELAGEHGDDDSDEVLYVLDGTGSISFDGDEHELRPETAVFVARGTAWSASGDARALSVLVHDPEPAGAPYAVADLAAADRGTATAGRAFTLGATPELGCKSATQFVGLIPPGRAPVHFHAYDEVVYVLAGEGELVIGGETAPLRPGACVHLPARLVHCLANTGESEMRVLGVFRPAGSPAEAYYPDGTPAAVPEA